MHHISKMGLIVLNSRKSITDRQLIANSFNTGRETFQRNTLKRVIKFMWWITLKYLLLYYCVYLNDNKSQHEVSEKHLICSSPPLCSTELTHSPSEVICWRIPSLKSIPKAFVSIFFSPSIFLYTYKIRLKLDQVQHSVQHSSHSYLI